MRVFNLRRLIDYGNQYAGTEQPLRAWYGEAKNARWERWADVRSRYPSADLVGDHIVFNIRGNHYRLIVAVDWARRSLFIKWFGPHAAYDKMDVLEM